MAREPVTTWVNGDVVRLGAEREAALVSALREAVEAMTRVLDNRFTAEHDDFDELSAAIIRAEAALAAAEGRTTQGDKT